MRVLVVVLSMMIGAAGCAGKVPETPQPTPATADASPPATTAPAQAIHRAAIDCDKHARRGRGKAPTNNDGQACCAGRREACYAFDAREAVRVSATRETCCACDAGETRAVNGHREACADETRDACADTKPATPPAQTAAVPATPAPRAASPNPTLDLTALKDQLKSTKAIGLMTKLTLKNQVDDLLDGFRDHYAGKGKSSMPQLRQSYDMLMMKVLSLTPGQGPEAGVRHRGLT